MEISKTLYVTTKKEWRSWLEKNHDKEKEIWLVYYKKHTGKKRIPYNDAVEEALCYGWIDSTAKKIDDERFAQRFTPRRKTSVLSEMNKERIRRLIKDGRMTKFGLDAVAHAFKEVDFKIATDIINGLKSNEEAWKNWQKFSDPYKRIRVGYLEAQRKHSHESFQKALNYLIRMTAKNKKFGMVQ